MFTINLEGIRFFTPHGIYPEERILGNEMTVDLRVSFPEQGPVTALSHTVDYERLYAIVRAEMEQGAPMLEQTLQACADRIKEAFPDIRALDMTLSKCHPPLPGEVARSAVRLQRSYP